MTINKAEIIQYLIEQGFKAYQIRKLFMTVGSQ